MKEKWFIENIEFWDTEEGINLDLTNYKLPTHKRIEQVLNQEVSRLRWITLEDAEIASGHAKGTLLSEHKKFNLTYAWGGLDSKENHLIKESYSVQVKGENCEDYFTALAKRIIETEGKKKCLGNLIDLFPIMHEIKPYRLEPVKSMSKKDRKDMLEDLKKSVERNDIQWKKEFHNNPDKYLSIDELGDLRIGWLYDRYAALRLLKNMYLFDKAYELMTERKNFSRRNAFGEMHGDCYMWIEKCDHSVIVFKGQSYKRIFIKENYTFHIRDLYYSCLWREGEKQRLKGLTVKKLKENNFERKYNKDNNNCLKYGDARDRGYIATMDMLLEGRATIKDSSKKTLMVIDHMQFWEPYLDDPDSLG